MFDDKDSNDEDSSARGLLKNSARHTSVFERREDSHQAVIDDGSFRSAYSRDTQRAYTDDGSSFKSVCSRDSLASMNSDTSDYAPLDATTQNSAVMEMKQMTVAEMKQRAAGTAYGMEHGGGVYSRVQTGSNVFAAAGYGPTTHANEPIVARAVWSNRPWSPPPTISDHQQLPLAPISLFQFAPAVIPPAAVVPPATIGSSMPMSFSHVAYPPATAMAMAHESQRAYPYFAHAPHCPIVMPPAKRPKE